jgi:hypothetical protein
MIFKKRSESKELLALRSLNIRMTLSQKEKHYFLNLEKGFEGEVKFDHLSEKALDNKFVLNDLLIEVNHSYSQIDTLSISDGAVHLLNIKNYEGDCYFKGDKLFRIPNQKEYQNPLLQLQRSATIMRQALHDIQEDYLVKPYAVFVNPQFTLYQAPLHQPIIYPTQLTSFLKELENSPSTLSAKNRNLANKLAAMHRTKNPFTQLPKYQYDQLQKGVFCEGCRSFSVSKVNFRFVCVKCGKHETFEKAILRHTEEFKLLFPERKITTTRILEWCGGDLHRRTICRALRRTFTSKGSTKDFYFE